VLLAALIQPGGSHPLLDLRAGRVKVKLQLQLRIGAGSRARLEGAGLRILQLADRFALGWIEIDALAALAELTDVEAIEPGRDGDRAPTGGAMEAKRPAAAHLRNPAHCLGGIVAPAGVEADTAQFPRFR
jgi:hypothetical protein